MRGEQFIFKIVVCTTSQLVLLSAIEYMGTDSLREVDEQGRQVPTPSLLMITSLAVLFQVVYIPPSLG